MRLENLSFIQLYNHLAMCKREWGLRFKVQVRADAKLARLCDMAAAWLVTLHIWHAIR